MTDTPEVIPSAESEADSPKRDIWTRWWIRILILIIHMIILATYVTLSPDDYAVRFGAAAGFQLFIGTIFLWTLLCFARTRGLVLLFCCLVVVQFLLVMPFIIHYRTLDKLNQEISAEHTKSLEENQRQIASYHVERIFEMLTPGIGFNPQELPELLQRTKAAGVKFREMTVRHEKWLNEAEKRMAAVDKRDAKIFRLGIDKVDAAEKRAGKFFEDYLGVIENLISFFIEKQDHYRFDNSDLIFERQQDLNAYQQLMDRIASLRKQYNDSVQQGDNIRRQLGVPVESSPASTPVSTTKGSGDTGN
jgi:hypothetical protein